jgi:hypothetical protein
MKNKQECKKTKDKIRSGKTLLHCWKSSHYNEVQKQKFMFWVSKNIS